MVKIEGECALKHIKMMEVDIASTMVKKFYK